MNAIDTARIETGLLIGAEFQLGQETPEPILNPRTGGLILNVSEASLAQVDAAVGAARRALELPAKQREAAHHRQDRG